MKVARYDRKIRFRSGPWRPAWDWFANIRQPGLLDKLLFEALRRAAARVDDVRRYNHTMRAAERMSGVRHPRRRLL